MAKILIAEDERDIRDLIEFTLTYAGHQVFKAANGAEAVELAPKVLPELIMMDVRMPRMTGYEACRAMKAMETVRDIPVVFLSAKGQESEIDTGLDAGAYDYILKPFEPFSLVNRVAEILARFQTESAAKAAAPADSDSSANNNIQTKTEAMPAPDAAAAATSTPVISGEVQSSAGEPKKSNE